MIYILNGLTVVLNSYCKNMLVVFLAPPGQPVDLMIAEASHRIRTDSLVLTGDLPLPFWPDWHIETVCWYRLTIWPLRSAIARQPIYGRLHESRLSRPDLNRSY